MLIIKNTDYCLVGSEAICIYFQLKNNMIRISPKLHECYLITKENMNYLYNKNIEMIQRLNNLPNIKIWLDEKTIEIK